MPRLDGKGPMSLGAMSGKGLGLCNGNGANFGARSGFGLGLGRRSRQGCRKKITLNRTMATTQKELLVDQKERLENRLNFVNQQLKSLV